MEINDQYGYLEHECQRYGDSKAMWVLYAISRYINTGRSSVAFNNAFKNYNPKEFDRLIARCLKSDLSDDGIIKSCKKEFCLGG